MCLFPEFPFSMICLTKESSYDEPESLLLRYDWPNDLKRTYVLLSLLLLFKKKKMYYALCPTKNVILSLNLLSKWLKKWLKMFLFLFCKGGQIIINLSQTSNHLGHFRNPCEANVNSKNILFKEKVVVYLGKCT